MFLLFLTSDSPRKFWHKHVVFLILLRRPLYVEKRNSPNGSNSRFPHTLCSQIAQHCLLFVFKFSVYYQTKNIPENTIFYSMNPSQHLFLLSCISSFQLNCLTFLHPIYPQHSSFPLASYCNPIPPCIVTSE